MGHLRRKCLKPEEKRITKNSGGSKLPDRKLKKKSSKIRLLAAKSEINNDGEASIQPDGGKEWPIFSVTSNSLEEILIPLKIESQYCEMELDTSASLSIISEDLYREKFKDLPVKTTDAILKTYTSLVFPVVGQVDVEEQPLVLGHGGESLLFRRNWLEKNWLNWEKTK